LKLATPILEFGTAKPSVVDPMGRTVKVSVNIQQVGIGLVRSVDCEYRARTHWFMPAPATCPVAQVGIIVLHLSCAAKKCYVCLIYFLFFRRFKIKHTRGSEICLYL
jgi:hypothetical protein